jgi:hypothetical protein
MYLAPMSRFSASFSSFALVHEHQAHAHSKKHLPSSLFFSSFSRSTQQLMAPSMEIE